MASNIYYNMKDKPLLITINLIQKWCESRENQSNYLHIQNKYEYFQKNGTDESSTCTYPKEREHYEVRRYFEYCYYHHDFAHEIQHCGYRY